MIIRIVTVESFGADGKTISTLWKSQLKRDYWSDFFVDLPSDIKEILSTRKQLRIEVDLE